MSERLPFDFEIAVDFFEKAGEDPSKQRRIGGLASVETKDRQDETILQRGLDFSDFLSNGWFNDNHSKVTTDILGYPETAKFVRKGTQLPNGKNAVADGHWVEGYLLNTEKADKVWELGQALQKTNRRLGFSVEGKIQKRIGPANKTIAKALVRNVAITNCPVNTGATMEILAKSLEVVEATDMSDLEKTLSMGPATPGVTPVGPRTGEGAGAILTPESLEHGPKYSELIDENLKKQKRKRIKKALTDSEIQIWFQKHLPLATSTQIDRVVRLTRALKRYGKI